MNSNVYKRAQRVLEIAQRMAEKQDITKKTWLIRNRLDDMHLHTAYAERGYTNPSYGVIVTGNWNDIDKWNSETNERVLISNLPSRLAKIFDKMGIETEWSDEWCACHDCGKIMRTQPDSHSWEPSYDASLIDNGECICLKCSGER